MGAGPVWSSLSRAIDPPVRNNTHLYGIPDMRETMKTKVAQGNSFALYVAKLVHKVHLVATIWVENPDSSFLWLLPPWQSPIDRGILHIAKIDYCRFGAPWRKRTRFATNAIALKGIRCLCTRDHAHIVLKGTSLCGLAWTKVAEPYPHGVAKVLAAACSLGAGWTEVWPNVDATAASACKRARATGKF